MSDLSKFQERKEELDVREKDLRRALKNGLKDVAAQRRALYEKEREEGIALAMKIKAILREHNYKINIHTYDDPEITIEYNGEVIGGISEREWPDMFEEKE